MSLIFSFIVWILMAAVLVSGIVMAVNGHFWLLIVGLLGFVLGLIKVGILPHS